MAGVSVYVGLPKSGKTYEVVQNVVAGNLKIGRRVVSNIAGLNLEKIREYCGDPEVFGELVSIDHTVVDKPGFFPIENSSEPSIVQAGDVVVLDEVWRWYATGQKIPAGHLEFFRMHAHYTDAVSGYTCDVVLITQDVADLQRKIRSVVSRIFSTHKHRALGAPRRYRLTVYDGNRVVKTAVSATYQRRYDPAVFPLYLSHSQKRGAQQPIERDADARGVIWTSPAFMYGVPIALAVLVGSSLWLWNVFSPSAAKTHKAQSANSTSPPKRVAAATLASANDVILYSPVWRVSGSIVRGGQVTWVLTDGQRMRHLAPTTGATWTVDGVALALPEGGVATTFSGQPSGMPTGNVTSVFGGRQ
jgi:zona occludens toxin